MNLLPRRALAHKRTQPFSSFICYSMEVKTEPNEKHLFVLFYNGLNLLFSITFFILFLFWPAHLNLKEIKEKLLDPKL